VQIYDKPVRELFHDFVQEQGIRKDDIVTRDDVVTWFESKYPKIKQGTIAAHLLRMSVNAPSRIHYSVRKDGSDDLFFQIDSHKFRLYDTGRDPIPIYSAEDTNAPNEADISISEQIEYEREFAYERDLKNFLAKNMGIIEPGLCLYEEEEVKGIEYPAGGRFIDLLGIDKKNNLVVIELKVSKGYDRVIGQLLRYIAWIKKNLAEPVQRVRGVIIASIISEDLKLAASEISDISLFEYDLSISLRRVT